jgi:hypothetical protein
MNKFCPNIKRLIECKMPMRGPLKKTAKASEELDGILAARIQVMHTHFYMIHTFSIQAGLVE